MKKFMGNNKIFKRAMAMLLTTVMVLGYIPVSTRADAEPTPGTIQTVADTQTLTRPDDVYGSNTLNAGKVTVGKSVHNGTVSLEYAPGKTQSYTPATNNFLVTMSQSAQVMGLTGEMTVPVDAVFVIDTSGSMDDDDRAESLVTAANAAIATLMAANPNNRVAVVGFSSGGYGGTSGGQNPKNPAASQMSPLAHYTGNAATNHLQWVTSGGSTSGDGRNFIAGRNADGSTGSVRHGYEGGTNIQAGIAVGAKILTDADTVYVQPDGTTVTRMPFLIIISDGQPTFTCKTANWYNPTIPTERDKENGPGSSSYEGNGFLAALTAAYYKGAITQHYYGSNASNENRCRVYTVGVDIEKLDDYYAGWNYVSYIGDDQALAETTLDPKSAVAGQLSHSYYTYGNTWNEENDNNKKTDNSFKTYWEKYQQGDEFTIRTKSNQTFTITKDSINNSKNYVTGKNSNGETMYAGGIAYNDAYYSAASGDLNNVFNSLVTEINMKAMTSPTHVSTGGDKNFDGYVTFTDPIGEYMEVKSIKGILANGHIHAGATFAENMVNGGTASFNNTLKNVLKKRLSMTGSNATDDFINNFIASAKSSPYQANFTSPTNYDNSIVWWGKEFDSGEEDKGVQVLGHANNDTIEYIESQKNANGHIMVGNIAADYVCRSYFFVCDADASHELMYLIVRVQRELVAPYKETVVISVPASLLSVSEVLINETTTNNTTTRTAEVNHEYPLRVTYEVGLRSDINAQNVDSIVSDEYRTKAVNGAGTVNYNSNGTYNFFTNDWNRSESAGEHHRAQAKATFDAAADNGFYAYQEDTLIVDRNGNPYTGNLSAKQELYYEREYYEWTGDGSGSYTATKKSKLIKITIPDDYSSVIKQVDGKWYISKGVFTASTLEVVGDDTEKGSGNRTNTSTIVSHAHRTGSSDNSHYTVLLGNNGLLSLVSEPAKTVSIGSSNTNDNGKVVIVGQNLTYTIKVSNTEASSVEAIVKDNVPTGTALVDGSAKVVDANGQAVDATFTNTNGALEWKFNIPANQSLFVSFTVTVTADALSGANDVVNIDNTATIKVGNNPAYTTNKVSNPPEGKKVVDLSGNDINGQTVKVGDVLTYRIRVQNDAVDSSGRHVAADVTVTDIIPAGTTFKSASHGGNYDETNRKVTWNFTEEKQMAANASVVLTLEVYVDASAVGTLENEANIKIGTIDPRVTNKVHNNITTGKISIVKAVSTNMPDATKEFNLVLTEATGKLNGEYTMTGGNADKIKFESGRAITTIKKDQVINIEGLPMGATIMVAEVLNATNDKGWEVKSVSASGSVTVSASTGAAAGDVVITNAYTPMPVEFQLKGQKVVDGDNFPDGVFTFRATAMNKDGDNFVVAGANRFSTANAIVANGKNAEFAFTPSTFTAPGTFYYLVEESATSIAGVSVDTKLYMLKLDVVDDQGQLKINTAYAEATKSGEAYTCGAFTAFDWTKAGAEGEGYKISFKNTYAPAATSVTLSGTKTLNGRNMLAGEFSFQLINVDTGKVVATANNTAANNGAAGTFSFAPLTFTAADMAGATDTDADGYVDKTFTYAIREVQGTDSHITYDKTYYEVKIKVEDVGGQLTATPTIKKWVNSTTSEDVTSIVYTNTYHTQNVSISLSGTKKLTGAAANGLNAEDFTFEVLEADSDWKATNKIASTGANGTETSKNVAPINFANITYSVDMFLGANVVKNDNIWTIDRYYIAKEVIPADSEPSYDVNMKYDETRYKIHVQVQLDIGKGEMTAKILKVNNTDVNAESYGNLDFTNIKNPDKVYFAPGAKKVVKHDDALPKGLRFSFRVTSLDGQKIAATGLSELVDASASNNEDIVDVQFTRMEFSQPGTYLYLIEETAKTPSGTNPDIIYDATKYVLAVVVSRDDNNKLTATGKYYSTDGKDLSTITTANYATELTEITNGISFTNTFNVKKTLNIAATKELTGNRELNAREFDFRLELLKKEGEAFATTGVIVNGYNEADDNNDKEATVTFGTLLFTSDELNEEYLIGAPVDGSNGEKIHTFRYHALLSEIVPGTNKLAGVAYDPSQYIVVMEMKASKTDSGEYTFADPYVAGVYKASYHTETNTYSYDETNNYYRSGSNLGVTFKNTYTAQTGTTVTLTATKQLNSEIGRALEENEFSFLLSRWNGTEWVQVETATNKKVNGTGDPNVVSFTRNFPATIDPAFFDQNTNLATFVYKIEEIPGGEEGMTYSNAVYYAEVVIEHKVSTASLEHVSTTYYSNYDPATGFSGQLSGSEAVVFENIYSVSGTTFTPAASKALKTWKDNDWSNVALDKYENAFSFEVVEVDKDGQIITVTQNDKTYAKVASSGNNGKDGNVKFTDINYSAPDMFGVQETDGKVEKTFYYMLREAVGTDPNVDYSTEKVFLKVVVAVENGELVVKGSQYGASLADGVISGSDNRTFTNYYGPYQLNLDLKLKKEVIVPEGGSYNLKDSEFDFNVYKYVNNQKGEYVTSGTNAAADDSNVANIIFGTIQITNADLVGREKDSEGNYIFKYLVEELKPGEEVNTLNGNNSVNGITYDKPIIVTIKVKDMGHGNFVQVGETYEQTTTQGQASDNKFTNIYSTNPAKLQLTANKILVGKVLYDDNFKFVLTSVDSGNKLGETSTIGENGLVVLPEITFTTPDTYKYTVTEEQGTDGRYTYDPTVYTVIVVVTDDGKGQLHETHTIYKNYVENQTNNPVGGISFTNLYTPSPITKDLTAQIGGTKKVVDTNGTPIVGRPIPEFTFVVTDALGNKVEGADGNPIIGRNDKDGKITFSPAFKFDAEGEYHYYITEKPEGIPGYTVDSNVWALHILVRYNKETGALFINDADVHCSLKATAAQLDEPAAQSDEKLTFVNVYEPTGTSLEIATKKNLEGRDLKDGEFTFHLARKNAEGKYQIKVAQTTNDADGNVKFHVHYSLKDLVDNNGNAVASRTFEYEIHEEIPETGLGGVTYTTTRKYIKVLVEDVGGKIQATITDKGTLSTPFANSYTTKNIEVPLVASKVLTGANIADMTFSFELIDCNGTVKQTVTNDTTGRIAFEPIFINHASMDGQATKKFVYTIREKAGQLAAMTYDETVYTATIDVTDDQKGNLIYTVTYTKDGEVAAPVFHNTYDASTNDTFASIKATKELTGKNLAADAFTFELVEKNEVIQTAKNTSTGDIIFTVPYTTAGSYSYILREVDPKIEGMDYDKTNYEVAVEVKAGEDGRLSAEVTYKTESGEAPVFKNIFTPGAIQVTLDGKKELEGRAQTAGEFKFEVRDGKGNLVATGTNDDEGNIIFTAIPFDTVGKYELKVSEVDNKIANVTYDAKVFDVTVEIVNDNGVLKATVTKPEGGIKFKNTYTEPPTEAPTEAPTEKPTEKPKDPNNPDTGDRSNLGLPVVILMVSLMGILIVLILMKSSMKGKYRK